MVVPRAYQLDYDRRRGWYEQGGVERYSWTLDVTHNRYASHTQVIDVSGVKLVEVQMSPRRASGRKKDR